MEPSSTDLTISRLVIAGTLFQQFKMLHEISLRNILKYFVTLTPSLQIFFGLYQVYTDLVPLASVQALVPQVK
jgi:hypothetical protein